MSTRAKERWLGIWLICPLVMTPIVFWMQLDLYLDQKELIELRRKSIELHAGHGNTVPNYYILNNQILPDHDRKKIP